MSTFLFGIHCHQPVDNFDHAVLEAIERSYFPLFDVLSRHEKFRFSVHFSGWLLEKIAADVPHLFALMQTMSARNQIEWLGGGYYEPILASISSSDRRGQIEKLSDLIEKLFGRRPRGIWLTERVWSDEILSDLAACGIEYTLVDDYHFHRAGFTSRECEGYYLSECGGDTLKIFPIHKELRYRLPFSPHEEALNAIESMDTAICFDDGEKFGLWPHTHEWVYDQGWLDSFVSQLCRRERISTMRFGDYIDSRTALGLAYLPNVSYYEMGNWSYGTVRALQADSALKILSDHIGPDEAQIVLGGGIWKNFLVKYPEANHIHKRMLRLSKHIGAIKDEAYREWVYKAQTNDVFWHGVFGGIYLPNLRDNAYRYIIEAQSILSRHTGYKSETEDFDLDGYAEVSLCNPTLHMILSTRNGGMIVELDRTERGFNLQNTLTRRREFYHSALCAMHENQEHAEGIQTIHHAHYAISPEASDALHFDFYRRGSFVDHFCAQETDLSAFYRCGYTEYGDFANGVFEIVSARSNQARFERRGHVDGTAVRLDKNYRLEKDALEVTLQIDSPPREGLMYVCELNLHFANLSDIRIRSQEISIDTAGASFDSDSELTICDPYLKETIRIGWNCKHTLWIHPVMSVSQSEGGIDLMAQGIMIAFAFVYEDALKLECAIRWERGAE